MEKKQHNLTMAVPKTKKGKCTLCGRENQSMFDVREPKCAWCNRRVKSGMTKDEVITEFLTYPPKMGGHRFEIRAQEAMKAPAATPEAAPKKQAELVSSRFPVMAMMPVWTCSDGTEFGQELNALRHELDLAHSQLKKRS